MKISTKEKNYLQVVILSLNQERIALIDFCFQCKVISTIFNFEYITYNIVQPAI